MISITYRPHTTFILLPRQGSEPIYSSKRISFSINVLVPKGRGWLCDKDGRVKDIIRERSQKRWNKKKRHRCFGVSTEGDSGLVLHPHILGKPSRGVPLSCQYIILDYQKTMIDSSHPFTLVKETVPEKLFTVTVFNGLPTSPYPKVCHVIWWQCGLLLSRLHDESSTERRRNKWSWTTAVGRSLVVRVLWETQFWSRVWRTKLLFHIRSVTKPLLSQLHQVTCYSLSDTWVLRVPSNKKFCKLFVSL